MKFSVIIPTWNSAAGLERMFRNLSAQNAEFEVLFVDDGSTDGTPEKCRMLTRDDPRFQTIALDHAGTASRSRNEGLRRADGDYIVFLDSDDELEPDALEKIGERLNFFHNPDLLSVGAREWKENETGGFAPGPELRNAFPTDRVFSGKEVLSRFAGCSTPLLGCSVLSVCRREFLLLHRLFQREDILMLEDSEWTPRVYFYAERAACADFSYYRYFRRKDSTTNHYVPRTLSDAAKAVKAVIRFGLSEEMPDSCRRFFAKHASQLFFTMFFHRSSVEKSDPKTRRSAFLECIGSGEDFREAVQLYRYASPPKRMCLPALWIGRFPGCGWIPDLVIAHLYYRFCGAYRKEKGKK